MKGMQSANQSDANLFTVSYSKRSTIKSAKSTSNSLGVPMVLSPCLLYKFLDRGGRIVASSLAGHLTAQQVTLVMAPAIAPFVSDRRSSPRYPIDAALQYRFVLNRKAVTGTGGTVNLSTDGVLFQTANPLPRGVPIELSIAWPARLDNLVGLNLHVTGKTVRTEGSFTAVIFRRHEFRTRGTRPDCQPAV
jgi:hypothetical protein